MTALPIDYEAVTDAVRQWVSDGTELPIDSVVWSNGDVPQLPRPFSWIFMLGGPRETAPTEKRIYRHPMLEEVTIETASAGQVYSIGIYEDVDAQGDQEPELYAYTALPGDSVDDIRDQLLAQIVEAEWPAAMAYGPAGSGAMRLAGFVDERQRFTLEPSAGITVETLYDGMGVQTLQSAELTFRVQVETESPDPNEDAVAVLSRARAALNTQTSRDMLRTVGLVFRRAGTPQDISFVADGGFVHRATCDIVFAIRTEVNEARRFVRRATVSVTTTGA